VSRRRHSSCSLLRAVPWPRTNPPDHARWTTTVWTNPPDQARAGPRRSGPARRTGLGLDRDGLDQPAGPGSRWTATVWTSPPDRARAGPRRSGPARRTRLALDHDGLDQPAGPGSRWTTTVWTSAPDQARWTTTVWTSAPDQARAGPTPAVVQPEQEPRSGVVHAGPRECCPRESRAATVWSTAGRSGPAGRAA
jgi:hypothetical protein